jgi:hypothetical protein
MWALLACAHLWYRTELYFGRSMPNGGQVSDAEWQAFVDEVVAPRFPDGFTVLDASGGWRGADGKVVREPSKVLVVVHGARDEDDIEAIRAAYLQRFKQESVLVVEERARVGF